MGARERTAQGLLLLVLGAPTIARADPAADPAEVLTRHGVELRRQRRDREALDEFRRAYELAPTPHALAQIALAEQALGLWVDAERDLQQALRGAEDPWIVRNRDALQSGLATIASRLASLEVTADGPDAELWVNGARAAGLPLPVPLRVEAGTLVIDVRARGYAPMGRETSAEPGGSIRETMHLVPLEVPPVAARQALPVVAVTPEQPRGRGLDVPMRNSAVVLLGAGAVGLATGAYFGARTLATKSSRDSGGNCTGQACNATGVALDAEARALALRSTVWFSAGLGAAAGGAVLLWVSRSRTTHDAGHGLRLAPEVGPDRAGLRLGGTW